MNHLRFIFQSHLFIVITFNCSVMLNANAFRLILENILKEMKNDLFFLCCILWLTYWEGNWMLYCLLVWEISILCFYWKKFFKKCCLDRIQMISYKNYFSPSSSWIFTIIICFFFFGFLFLLRFQLLSIVWNNFFCTIFMAIIS